MICVIRARTCVVVIVILAGIACSLKRPDTIPSRMIEPQLLEPPLAEPQNQGTSAPNAVPIRLLDTQARSHIAHQGALATIAVAATAENTKHPSLSERSNRAEHFFERIG